MIRLFPVIDVDVAVRKRGIATLWGAALEIIRTTKAHHEN